MLRAQYVHNPGAALVPHCAGVETEAQREVSCSCFTMIKKSFLQAESCSEGQQLPRVMQQVSRTEVEGRHKLDSGVHNTAHALGTDSVPGTVPARLQI